MKKGLLILIVAALVLGLTSCSQDVYSKLGDMMGKMGNNVYRIKPNMAQVEAATQSLSGSVKNDGSVDLDKAANIISAVADVKNSAQKTKALKAELSKPVSSDKAKAKAVQEKLQDQVKELAKSLGDTSGNQLLGDVQKAIKSITISETPTMAELATVAVLNEMAKTANEVAEKVAADASSLVNENGLTKEGQAIAESALGSLDTLKLVSEVASVDVLGDLDLTALLSSFRDISRDSDESQVFEAVLKTSVVKIADLVTENGEFSETGYKSFISQSRALKSGYDLAASIYTSGKRFADLDNLLKANIDMRFTIEDLVFYAVISIFSEADTLAPTEAQNLVKAFIDANKDVLKHFDSDTELTLPDTDPFMNEVFKSLDGNFDPKTAGKELGELIANDKIPDVLQILGTATVILTDAEYQSLLKFFSEEGTISGLLGSIAAE